jgi:predicted N-formylglutamate amidohydrolase
MVATLFNAAGSAPLVLICEHASNFIPADYGALGLTPDDLTRHIAWDPGALPVAKAMAVELDAPLVFATVSRLVIDLNRAPTDFDAMPEISETSVIPGNIGLSEAEKDLRVKTYYKPFHDAVDRLIAQKSGLRALVSVHSFTPVYKGVSRPWHVGLITGSDNSLARSMLQNLKQDEGLVAELNVPYSPSDRVYHTLDRHNPSNSVKTAMIELRNDLIASEQDQSAWGLRLAHSLQAALRL